ncbi:MAG: hypothetical protein WAM71_09345, partial [Candidatus Korobacteraceae bacterium]
SVNESHVTGSLNHQLPAKRMLSVLSDGFEDGHTQDEREYHANAKDHEQDLCDGRESGCDAAKSEHSEDDRQYGANQCPLQHA